MSVKSFTGKVGGATYTDPTLFEAAARALGYGFNGRRTHRWKPGTPIRITFEDGTAHEGQVWSRADVKNYVWVALDNGTFVAVNTPYSTAYKRPQSSEQIGRVA